MTLERLEHTDQIFSLESDMKKKIALASSKKTKFKFKGCIYN